MAIINGKEWTYLTKKGEYYEGNITPVIGELKIGYKLNRYDNNYKIILNYKVENGIQQAT